MGEEGDQVRRPLLFCFLFPLSLFSFVSSLLAEFKKSKERDVKVDGRLCYVPGSDAFWFGIAALICVLTAQITGSIVVARSCCQSKRPTLASAFLVLSWFSCVVAAILMAAGASMNRKQPYGKGWLNGECYVVKDGVYAGAAVLVLLTLGFILTAAHISLRIFRLHSPAQRAQLFHSTAGQ